MKGGDSENQRVLTRVQNIQFESRLELLRRNLKFFSSLDPNGNLDPEAPPPTEANYARRRSRAVLYQLSGHYKQDRRKSKLKLNNVRQSLLLYGF